MSREIKFRIWDNKNNEWLGASDNDVLTYYGFHLVGEVMTVQSPPQWALDPDCVIEQYTGLTDKNGKEIYEGDIVKVVNKVFNNESVGFIKYDVDSLAYYIDGLEMIWAGENEVIGNIHENPELLKGGEDE